MTTSGWIQLIFYFVVLVLLVKPLGLFMAKVYQGERTLLDTRDRSPGAPDVPRDRRPSG